MRHIHLLILAALLTLTGGGLLLYKVLVLDFPLRPDARSEIWDVEVRLRFTAAGGAAKVTLQIPPNAPQFTIVSQNFVAGGFGLLTASEGGDRHAIFSRSQADGEYTLYYRALVQRSPAAAQAARMAEPAVAPTRLRDGELAAARAILSEAQRAAADNDTLVRLIVRRLAEAAPDDAASLLLGAQPGPRRLAEIAAELLHLAGLPARTAHGLALRPDRRDAAFEHWLEYFADGRWRPFDPRAGAFAAPPDTLPWWHGPRPLASVEGGGDLHVELTVRESFAAMLRSAIAGARATERTLVDLSTLGLPLRTQAVYQVLLVVPVGILLLVVIRNVVGLRTFGTFMPVLIALAFRETELLWGLALFCLVLACGLGVRFYLERLKLLLVPRLASVVIVVILIMSLLSVASHRMDFERGLSVALFPIVILAMTIERMTVVWEERGPQEAFVQAFGSLVAASLCYAAMNLAAVRHIALVFPETLLIVLAAVLLLGRYSGYRLTELVRFRALAGKDR